MDRARDLGEAAVGRTFRLCGSPREDPRRLQRRAGEQQRDRHGDGERRDRAHQPPFIATTVDAVGVHREERDHHRPLGQPEQLHRDVRGTQPPLPAQAVEAPATGRRLR